MCKKDEVIDKEAYRQLELLGMVDNKASMKPIAGLVILILIQMMFMFILFERSETDERKKRNALLVTVIVYSLSIVLMKFISLVANEFDVTVAFLFPTALATMLVRLLADDRVSRACDSDDRCICWCHVPRRLFVCYANGNYVVYYFWWLCEFILYAKCGKTFTYFTGSWCHFIS